MTRLFDIREPSLAALQDAPIYFRYGSNKKRILVDAMTARAILACHAAISDQGARAKFERMVAGTPRQFARLVDFCWSRVRI